MEANTAFGKKYNHGSKKKVARRTMPEQTKLAICVLPPTSPLILDLDRKPIQRPCTNPGGTTGEGIRSPTW